MLRLAIALGLICFSVGQLSNGIKPLIEQRNVLSPPYFNIASGKKIDTTSTCGSDGPELFCKLTGGTNFEFSDSLHQGQVCDMCDVRIPDKAHPINNAIDGTEKWWQSPPLSRGNDFNKVNVTIHLGQVFHVAYVLIKFANSPRAGTWVLERSSDYGATFQPWQYFANTDSDCYNLFGMGSLEEITRDDSVVCTSDYSGVVPLENGEVIVSMIKGRPGSNNFSYATILQEWSKATNVRLRFLRTKTLLGHLMAVSEQDPTVTRRYYYSIKDISIGGRCVCNGHADTCSPDPEDQYKLKCECRHNTCGDSCEYCCPGFVQKAWRAAVPESTNECEACNCHGHSEECLYDEDVAIRRLSLDLDNNYQGGGVCQNCLHNTAGTNCEQCASGYWRPAEVDPRDPNGCRACNCDSTYTVGSCEPNTGRCYCKVQYAGDRCDRCAPGYYDFPECRPCDCYYNGTLDDVCLPIGDAGCPCKYNFAGKYCDECAAGFYNFPVCDLCECEGDGVASDVCDPYSGECPCADGFTGPKCRECAAGYFNYPLCQRCPCSDVGTTDEVCDPITGECFCGEIYAGASCDDCKAGHFGFPLCKECQCTAPGSQDNACDTRSGRCLCKPNYQGERCDECAPEYYGYPNCVSCACDVRGSQRTTCDQTTGQCLCFENIGGRACDVCTPDYFNFPRCEECSCDERGIVSVVPGVCLAFTTGQCECKDNVIGRNCDMCKPLHYDINRGCVSCNCFIQGTLDGVGECDREDGQCWCKPYTCTQRCSQCDNGFFALEELNYLGCTSCQCDVGGSMSYQCDKNTGQCQCKDGIGGRRCNRALDGFYYPNLYQNQYELEDGRTPENTIVRAGFDSEVFPDFSMRGYAQFSVVQRTVVIPVVVHNSGLYRLMFRYLNTGETAVRANVTVTPNNAPDGDEQSQTVTFEVTSSPRVVTVATPFVLNRGTWTVVLDAAPGLLVDYLVLLPSQYYEPGILELSITVPCIPTLRNSGEECVMYTHPSLAAFTTVDLTAGASSSRVSAPTTAHPEMLSLNTAGGIPEDSQFTTDINLPSPGKYVLVLEYASTENRLFQRAMVSVTDGAGNTYNDVKFNIYHCPYSFLCRQVALGVLNDVMVFDMSLPVMKVNVHTEAGGSFHVKSVTAIPFDQWTMELVEPKPRCITTQGPEFDQCIQSSYNIPFGTSRFNVPEQETVNGGGDPDSVRRPPTISDDEVQLVYLDGADDGGNGKTTLQIPMNLQPGRYVFIVHYYNPDHTSFNPRVVIDGGVASTGTANVTYCPHGDGCRAIVTTDDSRIVVDITVPTTTFTIVVPEDKAFWIQYVLAVPEDDYNPSLLDLAPIDKSGAFVVQCSTDGQQSFYNTLDDPSEFCRENIFSLTVDYNKRALDCDCNGAGTIGGGDASCEEYGGQCPCRENVVGRQCDRCMIGFYNFPECHACDCDGALCDETSGECICPVNTIAPACDTCAPFTHSFHPLLGCVECDCNVDGVINVTDTGCDSSDGQCRCKDHVTGQRCDSCEAGYFGFPNCQQCTCDERGIDSDGCDSVTGQCRCKDNVEGLQCDRCKAGSFYLDINNPQGCTECFCFGAQNPAICHSSQYPATETYQMEGWRMLNLVNLKPDILSVDNGRVIQVNVAENGGPQNTRKPELYWAAPKDYLGDRVSSYGGKLRYTAAWALPQAGRGDAADDGGSFAQPAPLLGAIPDLILKGNQLEIVWVNPAPSESVLLDLTETNFQHKTSGNDVTRPEMMMVLADLQALHIRAAPENGVVSVTLQDVVMYGTDYSLPIGSADGIPAVEECTCPEGYHGHSCQLCDEGYYREKRGPYLGYCRKCDCFGHCITCDDNGQLISNDACLHNTDGPSCGVCEDGYIGNATSGEIDACQPCPCPFPSEEGNFADTCEEEDGELICHCKEGYTGERCELCASGYFGNPAVRGGSCQPCNCHGNLDPNLIMPVCDPLTGACSDCAFNTGGKYCERCADGFYGDAIIARNCTECDCTSCGTEVCDHMMGHCSCRPHVIGELCDTCEPGYFDFGSCSGCRSCACAEGALGSECDIETGQCQCAPNIVGLRCDRCAPGFWEYSPMGCKPCNCRNNGQCNPANGECECPPGITGAQCDECELSRHILAPGATECTRCNKCTDDLLDLLEPMTEELFAANEQLKNVSVGVLASNKLQDLKTRANNAKNTMDIGEGFMSDMGTNVDRLLDVGVGELQADVSGSGENGGVSSGLTFGPSDLRSNSMYKDLESRITKTEAAVTEMCNHTKVLLHDVTLTENSTMEGVIDSGALETLATEFQEQANDLLIKLSDEASGDSADYFEMLRNAEMLLQRMKERDFSAMMIIADDELVAAEDLLQRIEESFSNPAMNVSSRVDEVSQDLSDTHAKLRDLRAKLNDATAKANDATTENAVNRKNLTATSDAINSINADSTMASEILSDAQQLLDGATSSVDGPITSGIADLEELGNQLDESYNQLEPYYNDLVAGLNNSDMYVNQTLEKTRQLQADAQTLNDIVAADLRHTTDAVNRYQNITNVINEASDAADNAVMEATMAEMHVADQNLQDRAAAAEERSSDLLSSVSDLEDTRLADLRNDMQNTNTDLDNLESRHNDLEDQLDTINNGIAGLDRGNIADDLAATEAAADDATRLAKQATDAATALEEQIRNAPDPNLDLARELEKVRATLSGLPNEIDNVNREAGELQATADRLDDLSSTFGMNTKMIDIRKKIELSRQVANTVKATMQFSPAEAGPIEFVQLRPPSSVQDTDKYVQVEFAVKVDENSPNGHLMYLGDATNLDGDYAAVETVDGRVRYNYKVGSGLGRIDSTVNINNGRWHIITIVRWGNQGKLIVEYPRTNLGRGDDDQGVETALEIREGTTDGDEVIANMGRDGASFYVGSNPLQTSPSAIQNSAVGNVCIDGKTKVNNETVGLWNFKAYSGQIPGTSCQITGIPASQQSNQVWRFRGQGSYVRIQRSDTPFLNGGARAHFVGMKLDTLQDNSLIFVIGRSTEQFMALEIVNGKFVMHWNFGFAEGPSNATVESVGDVTQFSTPLLIKAGLAPSYHVILLSVNLEISLQREYDNDAVPNIVDDIWIGGIWYYDVNPGPTNNSGFRDILKNIDTSFRGCVQDLNFNGQSFNIQNAKENIGVTRGCQKEGVQSLTVQGSDYVRMIPDMENVQDVEGGFTMRSNTATGTMMSATETQDSLNIDVINPKVVDPNDDGLNGGSEASNTDETPDETPIEPPAADPVDDASPPSNDDTLPSSDETLDGNDPALDAGSDPLDGRSNVENAKYGAGPEVGREEAGTPSSSSESFLPVLLLVIGVVVGIVLIAAIVSTVLKSSLVGSGAAAPPPPVAAEQMPLNDVQAQRTAQMDW